MSLTTARLKATLRRNEPAGVNILKTLCIVNFMKYLLFYAGSSPNSRSVGIKYSMNNSSQTMRLISWNINGRVKYISNQSQELHLRTPDVIALQKVLPKTATAWHERLRAAGWHTVDSFALQDRPLETAKRRQYGTLLASSWPPVIRPAGHWDKQNSFWSSKLAVIRNLSKNDCPA
jgi:hypothetical protein